MEIGVRLQGLWLDGLESLGVQVEVVAVRVPGSSVCRVRN